MDEKMLFEQMKFIRSRTLVALDSVKYEEVLDIPRGFNNNLLWNFGHIFWAQEELMHSFSKEKSEISKEWIDLFRIGSSPKEWKVEPPSLKDIREALEKQPNRIIQTFSGRLLEKSENSLKIGTELELTNLAEILGFINWHEGLHQGAITSIKKTRM